MSAPVQCCAECGSEFPPHVPPGLCPRCALSDVLKAADNRPGDSGVEAPPVHIGGRRSFGDYELLEEIARGGMGIVYKARQVSLDRIVAVKLLLLGQYASEEFIHRFRIEASAAASLQHPNIVAIHEVGVHQGQHYFAMDFVDGPDLAQLVREQPLPAKRAAGYVKSIAEAIHFAHTRRILHRDLKPSNVLIDSNDQPRVTDFGLAKNLANDSDLTLTGKVLGSPSFMPPEQALGERGKMRPASDIYSLGAILYHALTGRPPFVGETVNATLQQVESKEPITPRLLVPSVPADLETICLKCLEKEPSERFQSALELAEELGRFLRGEPIHSRPVSAPEKLWRWCRRKPAIASLGAATILLLLAVAIGSSIAASRINHARRQVEQLLYAENMSLAFKDLAANNRGRVLARLEQHRPKKPGDLDLRGWEWGYLHQQTRSDEVFALPESKHEINTVAFSPDGKYLASGEGRGRISIWDCDSRQAIAHSQEGRSVWPSHLQFSPDGRFLVTGAWKEGVRLWSWKASNLIRHTSPWTNGIIPGVRIDNNTLTAVRSQFLLQWDLITGRELLNFPIISYQGSFEGWAIFSPNGRMVATSSNSVVLLWDLKAGTMIKEPLPGHDSLVVPIAFSSDGRTLAGGGVNGTLVLWDVPTHREITNFVAHTSILETGDFSPDGKLFVTASYDHTVKLWDTSTWREVATLRGHLGEVYVVRFSPNGQRIASAGADGTVRFWSAIPPSRDQNSKSLPADVSKWSLSPDGQSLFLLFTDHTFSLWDLNSWQESARRPLGSTNTTVAALFTGGQSVALGDDQGNVKVVSVATLQGKPMSSSLHGAVSKLSCSFDTSTLVAQSTNDLIKAWDITTGSEIASFSESNNPYLNGLPLSRNGRIVVTAPWAGSAEFWELPSLRRRTILASDKLMVTDAAFFRDGKRVATSSTDKTAHVWELATGRSLLTMHSDQTGLRSMALAPDERRLAAGDDLGHVRKVKVWDLDTGQEVAVLPGHKEPIINVVFWPDGNTIVSVSRDVVFVWRGASIQEIDGAAASKAK